MQWCIVPLDHTSNPISTDLTRCPTCMDRDEVMRVLCEFESVGTRICAHRRRGHGISRPRKSDRNLDLLIRATPENTEKLRRHYVSPIIAIQISIVFQRTICSANIQPSVTFLPPAIYISM